MEARSAGRDCPGSGAAGPQSGYGLDSKTATAGYTALCLPLFFKVSTKTAKDNLLIIGVCFATIKTKITRGRLVTLCRKTQGGDRTK